MIGEHAAIAALNGLLATYRSPFGMPEPVSTIAPTVDWIYDLITWISIFFFVLIVGFMGYFMWKYRRVSHVSDTGGPTHHTPLEITWSVVPLILVIAIFYIGMRGYIQIQQAPTGAYEVYVTAQKWSWQFTHRNGASEVNVLDVPAGRPVKLIMSSEDVLHALFIPAFRVKQDIVPGRVRTLWFEVPDTTTEIRRYDLFCAEYCGTDHSRMWATVNVVPEAQFADYIQEKADLYKRLTPEQMPCYAALRLYPLCSSCHSLDGTDKIGPSFKGLWERTVAGTQEFTDGTVLADIMGPGKAYENADDYIYQSIVNSQKHIRKPYPGSMPAFQGQLKEKEVQAMRMFLKDIYSYRDEKGTMIVDCDFSAPAEGETGDQPASDSP